MADAQDVRDAAEAEAYRIAATKAHDRVVAGHKRVTVAHERATVAAGRAQIARDAARVAADAEAERESVRVAEADALMWSHRPGTSAYRAAFAEFAAAQMDAGEGPAGEAHAEADEWCDRALQAAGDDVWESDDDKSHAGSADALERAEAARKETMIEYQAFESDVPAGRFDAESACDLIRLHAKDVARAVRESEAAAKRAEACATEAEEWAAEAECAEPDVWEGMADLFAMGTPDAYQAALARSVHGVSDVVADDVRSVAVASMVRPVVRVAVLPGAVDAAEVERRAAASVAKTRAISDAIAAARAGAVEGVAVRMVRRGGALDGAPVDVAWAGYSERCWAHCPDDCPGQDVAEDCACAPRPSVVVDGPRESWSWQECGECAAGMLGVDVAAVLAVVSPAPVDERAEADALGEALYEEAVERERESHGLSAMVRRESERATPDTARVAAWRAEAAEVMAVAVACAKVGETLRAFARRSPAPAVTTTMRALRSPVGAVDAPAVAPVADVAETPAGPVSLAEARIIGRRSGMRDVRAVESKGGELLGYVGRSAGGLYDVISLAGVHAPLCYLNRGAATMYLRKGAAVAPVDAAPAPVVDAPAVVADAAPVAPGFVVDPAVVAMANAAVRRAAVALARIPQGDARRRGAEWWEDAAQACAREAAHAATADDAEREALEAGDAAKEVESAAWEAEREAEVRARQAPPVPDAGAAPMHVCVTPWERRPGFCYALHCCSHAYPCGRELADEWSDAPAPVAVDVPPVLVDVVPVVSVGVPADAPASDDDGRPYANGFVPAVLAGYVRGGDRWASHVWEGWWCDTDCGVCAAGSECADCEACTEFAAPYPAHWARDPRPGDGYRGVEIFGGPGGKSAGRAIVDNGGDWVLIELNPDAAATARAAGHYVICADVRTLDPRHPALRHVLRFHGSPPCQTLSSAGKRSGWDGAEIAELQSVMWQASEAFGLLEVDDLCSLYGGPHHYFGDVIDGMEDHPDAYTYGDECGGGFLPPNMTPADFRAWAASVVSDERTALMAEMLIWPMCMAMSGAPLESVTLEQSANLLRQTPALAEALQSEFLSVEGFGWAWCSWQIADAADTGAASHRERAWMVATRESAPRYAARHADGAEAMMWGHIVKRTGKLPQSAPELHGCIEPYQGRNRLPVVTVADVVGLPGDWWADTRGKRGTTATGTKLGGGSFPLNTVAQCVTAPWYGVKFRPAHVPQGEGSRVITREELAMLVGFPADYPWQYTPARRGAKGTRNVAQMIADAVSPFMMWIDSAVNPDAADWYEPAKAYQARIYGTDGGGTVAMPDPAPAIPAQRTPLAIESGPAPSRLQITGGRPVQLAICATPAVLPPTGRPFWEPYQRVTLGGRAGSTRHSSIGHGVRVQWDHHPHPTYENPAHLWAEGTEPAPRTPIAPPYCPAPRTIATPYTPPTPEAPPMTRLDADRARHALALVRRLTTPAPPVAPQPEPEAAPVAPAPPVAAPAPDPADDTAAMWLGIVQHLTADTTPTPVADVAPEPEPEAAPLPIGHWTHDTDDDTEPRPTVGQHLRTAAAWYAPALLALLLLVLIGAPVAGGITAAVLAVLPRIPAWTAHRKARRDNGPTQHDHHLAA